MMKKLLALAFTFYATLAVADGVNRAVRIAPGPGVTGDRFVGPCTDGYGVMGRGASLDPSCQGFVASGSGALTRTWVAKGRDVISALDFATGDGTTNDTTAIANAIAATPLGGTLFFPCGSYKVIGASTAIFTRTTPIRIEGAGICSKIIVDSTVPNTRDLFLFTPAANYTGWAVKNLWITTNGGSNVAKNIINFDATANDTVSANDIFIEGLLITGAFNNYSIAFAGTALGASVFDVTVRNNRLDTGGVSIVNGGDSLRIEGNNISDVDTSRACVYSQQQAGAGNLYVTQNNMVCYSTIVTIAQGIAPVIMGNIAERIQAGTDAPLINITGASANVLGAQIVNNQLQVLGTRTAIPIYVAAATNTIIANNGRIAVPTGGVHYSITGAATGTRIGTFNNFFTNDVAGAANGSDSGVSTSFGLSTANLGFPFIVTAGPTVTISQAGLSLLGRSANTTGVSGEIIGIANQIARVNGAGTSLAFGSIDLSQSATVGSTVLSVSNGGTGVTTGAVIKVVVQRFTATGTYTPTTGMLYATVECVGGGGGGGSAAGSVGSVFTGAGGGAGAYSRVSLSAATVGASKAVTIGAGGAGGASGSNNGAVGGDTSVTTLCVAKGGSGGLYGSAAQVPIGGAGGAGASGTGDVTGSGPNGLPGIYSASTLNLAFPSGNGGSSFFGGGALGVNAATSNVAGNNGSNYGGGGSGAATNNVAANAAGGNGSAGIVIVTEYVNQ